MTLYEIQMLAGVNKVCNTCTPQTSTHSLTHPPPCHRIPSALPPPPSPPPFFLSFFSLNLSLCLPLYIAAAGGALLLLPRKGREGQAFTSPLPLLSFLSSVPPPGLCSSYSLLFVFDIQLDWSPMSEERRGRNSRTTVNF